MIRQLSAPSFICLTRSNVNNYFDSLACDTRVTRLVFVVQAFEVMKECQQVIRDFVRQTVVSTIGSWYQFSPENDTIVEYKQRSRSFYCLQSIVFYLSLEMRVWEAQPSSDRFYSHARSLVINSSQYCGLSDME